MKLLLARRIALAASVAFAASTQARSQSFQGIGDLPGGSFESYALGVSADGSTVVGRSSNASGSEAVRWRNGVLVGLGDVAGGSHESAAWGASADGSVIAGTGLDATCHRGVRWDGTVLTQLPQLPNLGGYSEMRGISSDGLTLCGIDTDGLITGFGNACAVRIDNGVLTALPYTVPNTTSLDSSCSGQPSEDGSVLPGRVRLGGLAYQACYWVGTTRVLLPQLAGWSGLPFAQCAAVSGDGSVQLGWSTSTDAPSNGQGEPCRWVNDLPQSLGALPGAAHGGIARAANRNGSIVVGTAKNSGNSSSAFIWDAQHGMRDLKSVLQTEYGLNLTGWTLTIAQGITPTGDVIVGSGTNPSGAFEGWIARLECGSVSSYCTAGTTTNGCAATLSAAGTPSASGAGVFTLTASGVEGQKQGLFFYGINGATAAAWGTTTSFLCVKSPTQRTPAQNSGGSAGACDGQLALDWNAFIASTPGALGEPFALGDVIYVQAWFRDPPSSKTTALSNALSVSVCP